MWITHMPSTPVAAYDGATGRAVKGGLLGGGGGGDILVGAHPGGLFALPSMDGETRGGGDDILPGTSVATIGAPDGLHGDGALFPVAVSSGARGREDDWACIPEKLWDDALTPGGLDSFLALHGGDPLEGAVLALTPLQRVMGSPVGAAAVVTVAVGFGTVVSYCVLFARTLRRREGGRRDCRDE
jgi:hypothetical protein